MRCSTCRLKLLKNYLKLLKSAKNRFYLRAGLNLEHKLYLSRGSNSLNSASVHLKSPG